jgi:hypothetical protein
VAQSTRDARRWLHLFIRSACAPDFSFKYWAMGSPSIRTIVNRLHLTDAMLPHDEREALALRHLTLMIKAAGQLGLNITV